MGPSPRGGADAAVSGALGSGAAVSDASESGAPPGDRGLAPIIRDAGGGRRIHLWAQGCRLNQAEMEDLGAQLAAEGLDPEAAVGEADLLVLNTCAVTAEAGRDARRLLRRWQRLRPGAAILVTGCQATLEPEAIAALPGVTAVLDNGRKADLGPWILGWSGRGPSPAGGAEAAAAPPVLPPVPGRSRAFLAAQDGCDQSCAFCVSSLARGAARSRRAGELLGRLRRLEEVGYQEVVLTGLQLGAWGRDLRPDRSDLGALLRQLLAGSALPRLRLSSLEPWSLGGALPALWQDPRLQPQLHLPIQTGSDRLLRSMRRRGGTAALRRLVAALRASTPELALGTDLVAGLPGETAADHRATLALVEELGFSRLHVFPFSPRPGTAAALMPDPVPPELRRERAAELAALGAALAAAHRRRQAGRLLPVLWEAARPGQADAGGRRRWSGLAPDGSRLYAWSVRDLWNRIVPARLPGLDGAPASPAEGQLAADWDEEAEA